MGLRNNRLSKRRVSTVVWIRVCVPAGVSAVVWVRIIRVSVPDAVVGTLKQLADQSDPTGRVEQYRYLEATVRARAWNETSPAIRGGWMNLAEAYGRLAEQAEEASDAGLMHSLRDPLD